MKHPCFIQSGNPHLEPAASFPANKMHGTALSELPDSLENLSSVRIREELLSNLVFKSLNQAAAWFDSVTSTPSLNFTPMMTCARYSNPR